MIRKLLMIKQERQPYLILFRSERSFNWTKKNGWTERKKINGWRKSAVLSQLTRPSNHRWEGVCSCQESTHTRPAWPGLARRQRHECQDHFSRETFQVQVSANICKLIFHEENKKLPMHGIANLLSITCPAGCAPTIACWVYSISCKLESHNCKKHSWFTINNQELISAEGSPAHDCSPDRDSCCCRCHQGEFVTQTPPGASRDGIQR